MPRRLFTEEDIRRLARDRVQTLLLAPDDIVTHDATDTALALGIQLIRQTEPAAGTGLPPLKVVPLSSVQVDPFLKGRIMPGTNVWQKAVVGPQDGSPMGTGYMSLDKGEMQRTLGCDEIDIVLEGELVVTRGSEQVRGRTGDVIYIPKGSSVTLATPGWVRFVYVVFPVSRDEE